MKRVFLDTNILVDYVLGREHGRDFAEFCNLPLLTAAEFLTELSGK